jgi:transcriptional regulator with XRE-family HTH domain
MEHIQTQNDKIKENILFRKKQKGLSFDSLAKKTGIPHTSLQRKLNRKSHYALTITELFSIAEVLGVPIDVLLQESESND